MKIICLPAACLLFSCAKQQVHAPESLPLSRQDYVQSINRAKNLNHTERQQIEQWIAAHGKKFYPAALNYWTDIPPEELLPRKKDGESVSYLYEIYDFNMSKFYARPKLAHDAVFGRFEEIKAVEDALRYQKPGTEATLLVPSVLAFGTYGDGKDITGDMPLIIKLKVLK